MKKKKSSLVRKKVLKHLDSTNIYINFAVVKKQYDYGSNDIKRNPDGND